MTDERERRPETPAEADGTTGLFTALGKMLKRLRERKGLTQKEFGQLVGYGPDAISAMERGVRLIRPEVLEQADVLLDAGGMLKDAIPEVREAMGRVRTRHPEWYRGYAALEAEAVELHFYANQAMPGLLQTEEYALTVFRQRRPLLSKETIDKRVTDRLSRQQVFERWPAPIVSYVIEEVLMDRPIGGPSVFKAQLQNLLRVSNMRNVALQVMPTRLEEHPNLDSAFNLLTPKKHAQVAYTEAQGFPRLITDPEDVRKIADRYGIMRAMALSPPGDAHVDREEAGGAMSDRELTWFKSSYSSGEGGECLEVATCPTTIHIRDSKDPSGPVLDLSPATWAAFTSALK